MNSQGKKAIWPQHCLCVFERVCLLGGRELINPVANMITLQPCGLEVNTNTHVSRYTHTHKHRPSHAACYSECPGLGTQQKQTGPKYHCRVPMSTLADATLIQSAMESHQAEWLREHQHLRAAVAAFGRRERLLASFFKCFLLYGLFR